MNMKVSVKHVVGDQKETFGFIRKIVYTKERGGET
jgi:hypothetical protein